MPKTYTFLTKEFLLEHYVEKQMTTQEICKEFNIKVLDTVNRALEKHDIEKRKRAIPTKEWLENEYFVLNKTFKKIGEETGIGRQGIGDLMKTYGITPKVPKTNKPHIIEKEFLIEEYVNNGKSIQQIAKECNIKTTKAIARAIKKFNIPHREYKYQRRDINKTPDKSWLEYQYIDLDKSANTIGEENGILKQVVLEWLHELNIKIKPRIVDRDYIFTREFLEENYIQNKIRAEDIAKDFGLSVDIIVQFLRFYDIPLNIEDFNRKVIATTLLGEYDCVSLRYFGSLKANANRRKMFFKLTQKYLYDILVQQDFKCKFSGIVLKCPVIIWTFKQTESTASVDRINNSLGYIEGNVQWVHKKINFMRLDLTVEEFIFYCKAIHKYQTNKIAEEVIFSTEIMKLNNQYWNSIRGGAKHRGLEFNITKEYIIDLYLTQNKKCKLSGLDILLCNEREQRTASLDRIDSTKGYVVGNVQWVLSDVNIMKLAMTEEEFFYWCKLVSENNP